MAADLAVLGLGDLGLPAAQAATAAAICTVGFTPDPRAAAELAAGRPPSGGTLAAAELRRMLARGFTATSDPAALARVRTALVCSNEQDAAGTITIEEAARALAPRLGPRTLVVLESTCSPGTTRDVLRPLLERGSGLRAGRDFHLAYAPGRPRPAGRAPRVIGGLTPACTEAAAAFYGRLTGSAGKLVRARGVAEAEAAQMLLTNARHVTTALVNETAELCHDLGIDLWDVLRCAESGPWPPRPAPRPGPGPGPEPGPGGRLPLVRLAREINAHMPRYVTRRAAALLNEHGKSARGARVLLLGLTGRPDRPGQAGSPAREIAESLLKLGAELGYHDPYVPSWLVSGRPVPRADAVHGAAAAADLTLLLQPHSVYDLQGLAAKAQLLLDTQGATPAGAAHRL
jgi:UDP-N-acetyl-D-glucosamine dehydrogenase